MAFMRRLPVLAGLVALAGCALDAEPGYGGYHGYGHYGPAPSYGYVETYRGYGPRYSYDRGPSRIYSPPPVVRVPDRRRDDDRRRDWDRGQRPGRESLGERNNRERAQGHRNEDRRPLLDRRSPADRGDLGG